MRSVLIILLIYSNCVFAQNLVVNPSFEEYSICPLNYSGTARAFKKTIKYWYSPTLSTPDYLNICSRGTNRIPRNISGSQYPKSGNAYVLLICDDFLRENYRKNGSSYNEYIQSQLKTALIKDHYYLVSFYVSLADKSLYAIDKIGALLTNKKIIKRTEYEIDLLPQIYSKNVITDKDNWTHICGIYKSIGEEEFITIGCFFKHNLLKSVNMGSANIKDAQKESRYYIDDVSVIEVSDTSSCLCTLVSSNNANNEIQKTKSFDTIYQSLLSKNKVVLKNIFFNTDEWQLLPESYKELNNLISFMQNNPQINIKVNGYTDNSGIEENNIKLSLKRAEAIVDYLIKAGVLKERLSFSGLGSSYPIESNNTEQGKAMNRRVEIEIINDK